MELKKINSQTSYNGIQLQNIDQEQMQIILTFMTLMHESSKSEEAKEQLERFELPEELVKLVQLFELSDYLMLPVLQEKVIAALV